MHDNCCHNTKTSAFSRSLVIQKQQSDLVCVLTVHRIWVPVSQTVNCGSVHPERAEIIQTKVYVARFCIANYSPPHLHEWPINCWRFSRGKPLHIIIVESNIIVTAHLSIIFELLSKTWTINLTSKLSLVTFPQIVCMHIHIYMCAISKCK